LTVCRRPGQGIYLKRQLKDKLIEHKQFIVKHGEDMPEIRNWNGTTYNEYTRAYRNCAGTRRRRQGPACDDEVIQPAISGLPSWNSSDRGSRRAYRELLVTTSGLNEGISGAILYDETIRQQKRMVLLCQGNR